MRVGDRVHVKNHVGLPFTEHGIEEDPTGRVRVQTFLVIETVTDLEVLWQDGTRESLKATEVIPYLNPDEYDCWSVLAAHLRPVKSNITSTGLAIMSYGRMKTKHDQRLSSQSMPLIGRH